MIKFKTDWPLNKNASQTLDPKLSGERVILSPLKWEDYDQWAGVRRRNKEFLTLYEPQWADNSLEQDFFKRRLERQKREMHEGRGAFFIIRRIEDQKIIGGVNMNNIQYAAVYSASLGYWLDQDCHRQGYMTEAIELITDYAFRVLKLHRLNAACLPDNDRSINLLLKLGFKEEGFAEKYIQINGQWRDHRLFGLVNPHH